MVKINKIWAAYDAEGNIIISKWLEFNYAKREIYYLGYPIKLTPREALIFNRIYEGKGKPVSMKTILDDCFLHVPISQGNINVHVCNINKKAKIIGQRDIVSSVYGKGYRIDPSH